MRAISIQAFTGPEGLALVERPSPTPTGREVRVRVVATAVNRADLLQSLGRYPAPPGAPADIPGLEFAGVVDATGEACQTLRVGDRVMAIVGGGSYAEALLVDERVCARVPEAMSLAVAGALPESLVTAHDALVTRGGLASGKRVLVHAATSGIGTTALRIAKAVGAESWATTRRAETADALRALGADHVVVVGEEGLEAAVKGAGIAGTIHTVLELVGARYVAGDLAALAPEGAIVVVGTLDGAKLDLDLGALMRNRARLQGTVLRARTLEEKVVASEAAFGLAARAGFASVEPVIAARFPLAEAAEAHRAVQRGGMIGRVAIDVAPEPAVGETPGKAP
jgi:NADPH:quinone reductase-like Zn-dependent oxidoreductase